MRHFFTFFILLTCVTTATAQKHISESKLHALQKIQLAEDAITALYVDSVADDQMAEDAIRGMLKNLDPHSSYTTAKETQKLTEPLQGSFEGIGVRYNMVEDTLLVISIITDGPSERVGILPGDRIVTVNDTAIAGVKMEQTEVMRRLRGKKGTKVNVEVCRRGISGLLSFTITRDKIPINTIDASYMADPQTGYIIIGSFGATTYDEFMSCIKELKKQGMRRLIIDLQNNGGGLLDAAVRIANEFLDKDELVTYTEGRTSPRREYKATGYGSLIDVPVVVLINEYTASASEILSGALQDHDRAVVVGRRSFGKGLVQRPVKFADGSMMRLTVSHYFSPSGRCIQKPYEKGESEEYAQDIEKRFKHGELYHADSIHFADSLKFTTLRRQRTVYGGGGIMPDVFVPLDTTQFTAFYRQLSARSYILSTTLEYMDYSRDVLKAKYSSFEAFNADYSVPQMLVDSILSQADKNKVKPKDEVELANTMPQLRLVVKALVARSIWGVSSYMQVVNPSAPIFSEGLKAFVRYDEYLARKE